MLERVKSAAGALRREARVYRLVIRHGRTPTAAKVLLALAVAYLMLPFDIIPDFIPVIGHLDDVIIVPLLVAVALRLVPRDVVRECREAAADGPSGAGGGVTGA